MSVENLAAQVEARQAFSATFRRQIDNECNSVSSKGEDTLWQTAASFVTSMSHRWTQTDSRNSIELFEIDCHDLWYIFTQAAKQIDATHPAQDRLVAQVLYARQLGTLQRLADDQVAQTSDGTIWKDLPYLARHLKDSWMASSSLSICCRQNLAAFIARLVGLGVLSNKLSICALWVFREALEVRTSGDNHLASEKRTSDLLSLIIIWLRYAGHQLVLQLEPSAAHPATNPPNPVADAVSSTYELVAEAGIHDRGFSVARWKFWQSRLFLLGDSQIDDIRDKAKRGAHMMYSCSTEVSSLMEERFDRESPYLNRRGQF